MNEDKFFEIECLECGKIGLLTNGLCRHGCGAVHRIVIYDEDKDYLEIVNE